MATKNANAVQQMPAKETETFAQTLERVVRDPTIDISRIQQLLDMKERMDARESQRAFDAAMSAAQAAMTPVSRDAANPQTRSRYASYMALDRALRPTYTKNGFAISFDTGESPLENHVRVVCLVTCAGHRESHHIDMPADGKGAKGGDVMTKTHATMSAVTYGRRGLLKMIFNIAEGEYDDDGNAAGRVEVNKNEIIDPAKVENLKTYYSAIKPDRQEKFLQWMGVSSVELIRAADYDRALAGLTKAAGNATKKEKPAS